MESTTALDARAERADRIARAFQVPMLIASALVIPVIIVEQSSVSPAVSAAASVLNWLTWLAFLSEVIVMLVVSPSRWGWIRSHPIEVAVVVLSPPFLTSFAVLRSLRLLRLVRLLRFVTAFRDVSAADGFRWAVVIALVTIVAGGSAFATVEDSHNEWDGIWWAVTTMTTVGYGDVTPATTTGRVVAMVVMLFGIVVITGLIGIVGVMFTNRFVHPATRETLAHVDRDVVIAENVILERLDTISERLKRVEDALQTNKRE